MKWKAGLFLMLAGIFLAGGNIAASTAVDTSVNVVSDQANVPGTPVLAASSLTRITASWSANLNPAGTEYYVENVTSLTNSGWITATSWESTGLLCSTYSTFKVKARDAALTETAFSPPASISTENCPSAPVNGSASNTGNGGVALSHPPAAGTANVAAPAANNPASGGAAPLSKPLPQTTSQLPHQSPAAESKTSIITRPAEVIVIPKTENSKKPVFLNLTPVREFTGSAFLRTAGYLHSFFKGIFDFFFN